MSDPMGFDLQLGDVVRVKQGPDAPAWASDWREEYRVCMLEWKFATGDGMSVNVAIIGDDEIAARHGWTDGFKPDQLEFIRRGRK